MDWTQHFHFIVSFRKLRSANFPFNIYVLFWNPGGEAPPPRPLYAPLCMAGDGWGSSNPTTHKASFCIHFRKIFIFWIFEPNGQDWTILLSLGVCLAHWFLNVNNFSVYKLISWYFFFVHPFNVHYLSIYPCVHFTLRNVSMTRAVVIA